ncbi:hypothetical protein PG996_001033 [Apiospora saccharicola]|uniref:Uncharacterized protein n=1 Tax=Apiospora saccharicola TaxID=335842 RepID=A0ABR1WGZ1_9PEZI
MEKGGNETGLAEQGFLLTGTAIEQEHTEDGQLLLWIRKCSSNSDDPGGFRVWGQGVGDNGYRTASVWPVA